MKQYALIRNGVVEMEGALPYFWKEQQNSPQIDMLSLNKEKLESLGWFEIREVNKLDNIDQEIQYQTHGPVLIIDNIPTREWETQFLNGVVSIFLKRNSERAEKLRQLVLTELSGQALEYEILSKEAEVFIDDINPDPMDYPLLFSTIDLSVKDKFKVAKIEAAKIISKRHTTLKFLAFIRSTRKDHEKKLIEESDPYKMLEIEKNWDSSLEAFAKTNV